MPRYFAKKTMCAMGHKHDSKREAERCAELHEAFRDGKLGGITYAPRVEFVIDGRPVKMGNGQAMRFTLDFGYEENGKIIYEDVKPKNGYMSRDVPVKIALFRHLFPEIELRIVK